MDLEEKNYSDTSGQPNKPLKEKSNDRNNIPQTEIKNAHAAGDGALERSEDQRETTNDKELEKDGNGY